MKRDIRIQVSVTRTEFEKLQYLADLTGIALGSYCYARLAKDTMDALPEGSDQAYRFDLMRRLKRVGQGYNEIEAGELEARVQEAIEHGATGKLPGSGDRPAADQSTLPGVSDAITQSGTTGGDGSQGDKPARRSRPGRGSGQGQ